MIDIWAWLNVSRIDGNAAVREAVRDRQGDIVQLNREQLDRGLKSDNSSTGQYSNIRYKGFLRPVNLKRTGTWQENIQLDIQATGFDFIDLDEKTVYLKRRYTDKILGLTPQNEVVAGQLIAPNIENNLRIQLGV